MLTPAKIPQEDYPSGWRPDTKALYTVASNNGWSHAGVRDLILLNFRKTSSKDLAFAEYNKVMFWLENRPANTTTGERDPFTKDLFG